MNRSYALYALTAALLLLPSTASAQTVLVRVIGPTSTPVFGALAHLVDPSGTVVKNALTDERGRALFIGIPAATYRVRVEMIGMPTSESELFEVAEGMSVPQDVRLESSAIQLEGIVVELDGGRCMLRPAEEGLAIAVVWDEARKALSAAAFTDQQGSYRYETMIYNRQLDTTHTKLDHSRNFLSGIISDIESIDTFTAIAEITQDQTMLEASYATLMRLSQLHLTSYF